MLNDWVYSFLDGGYIQLVDPTELYTILQGYDDGVEGIELCADILKENSNWYGHSERHDYYKFYTDAHCLKIRWQENIGYFLVIGEETVYIKYVHELQHLLRLCKLSEFADNFKVNLKKHQTND